MQLTRERKFILLASTLASFLTPFMGSAINLALPVIAQTFKLSTITLGWTVTAFLLMTVRVVAGVKLVLVLIFY